MRRSSVFVAATSGLPLGCSVQGQVPTGFIARVSGHSHTVARADIDALRHHGWSDLQIAETIHLTALFATFNRVVNAFGLSSQGLLATLEPMDTETKP